jgi:hypothetical protein
MKLLKTGKITDNDTYPKIMVRDNTKHVQHEVNVSRIDEERLYCLQKRGIHKSQAMSFCVNRFINELIQEFPLEDSVELKRLIHFEPTGKVDRIRRQKGKISMTNKEIHGATFLDFYKECYHALDSAWEGSRPAKYALALLSLPNQLQFT